MIGARGLAIGGSVLALALVAFAAPFASTAPDGLERVAADHGIAARAAEPARSGPSTAAALGGTLVVLALGVGLARLLARRPA